MNMLEIVLGIHMGIPDSSKGEKILNEIVRWNFGTNAEIVRLKELIRNSQGNNADKDYVLLTYLMKCPFVRDRLWNNLYPNRFRNLQVMENFLNANWHLTNEEILKIANHIRQTSRAIIFDNFTFSEGMTLLADDWIGNNQWAGRPGDSSSWKCLERAPLEYRPTFQVIYKATNSTYTREIQIQQ